METSIFDLIFLSETWLNDDFTQSEVKVTNYDIYRSDRDPIVSGRSRGGGVLIAVSSKLKSRRINVASPTHSFDHVFVHVQVGSGSLLLGCVYIPPSSDVETYVEHCNIVEDLCCRYPDSKVYLAGDYNLRGAKWGVDEDSLMFVDCHDSSPAVQLCESFNSLSLCQANSLPNDHGVFLDLLFTSNDTCTSTSCIDPLLSNNYHHNAFSFEIQVAHHTDQLSQYMVIYDYAKCDSFELKRFLNRVDWSFISSETDIEVATQRFYDFLLAGIEMSTPVKRVHRTSFPMWFSKELKSLIFEKKKAHSDYKRSGLESDYIRFSLLRSRCSYINNKCYTDFLTKSDQSLQANPRYFWKFANITRKVDGFPKDMYLNGETSRNGQETANLFARSFSSAYEVSENPIPEYPRLDCIDFNYCSFSPSEIYKALSSLPQKFSSGPDMVPPYILKMCAAVLANPLSALFNASLSAGVFPSKWKSSFIFPIHKSGDRSNIANYRGVCIQSSIPKVLDKLVSSDLSFACKQFISDQQHGFTTKRSTVTNLLCYQYDILRSFQSGNTVHSIYTDVAKAFDRVNTKFLVAKLRSYGIGDAFLRWLDSSFTDRTQIVKIGDSKSNSIKVSSGVGQGSHSGPLLFSLFFNDLPDVIKYSKFQMFADDVKIYKSISTIEDCILLQNDLDSFHQWLSFNNLKLTLSKCAVMQFSRCKKPISFQYHLNSHPLRNTVEIKDLGVIVDRKLSFSAHISNISMRCHRLLGYIFRTSKGLSPDAFRLLYLSLVRSLLEYACIVWSPCYQNHENMLDRVQKRFISYSQFRYPNSPLHIDTLKNRRLLLDSRFLQKLMSGNVDCNQLLSLVSLDCHRRLRKGNTFYVSSCHTNYSYHSPLNRIFRNANDGDFSLNYI